MLGFCLCVLRCYVGGVLLAGGLFMLCGLRLMDWLGIVVICVSFLVCGCCVV